MRRRLAPALLAACAAALVLRSYMGADLAVALQAAAWLCGGR
ncbi:hypothetical protein [Xenophilus azovorans]|nr:hypothetical protein [Xenophilus azovorans]